MSSKKENLEEKQQKEKPILFQKKEECCGCTACFSICPMRAIEMVEEEEGFLYPVIQDEKCVRCYQCTMVCPLKKRKVEGKN